MGQVDKHRTGRQAPDEKSESKKGAEGPFFKIQDFAGITILCRNYYTLPELLDFAGITILCWNYYTVPELLYFAGVTRLC